MIERYKNKIINKKYRKAMKQYIKPATVEENIALTTYMQDISGPRTTTESAQSNRGMDTKSRDVWSEGYW